MKINQKLEDYVYRVIKKFVPILLLQRHTFEIVKGVENQKALMECKYNYPYLNVTIRYSEEFEERWGKGEDMTPFIVHEMCHPITDPLYSKATERYASNTEILDERENLTDYICNIALKAYEDSK